MCDSISFLIHLMVLGAETWSCAGESPWHCCRWRRAARSCPVSHLPSPVLVAASWLYPVLPLVVLAWHLVAPAMAGSIGALCSSRDQHVYCPKWLLGKVRSGLRHCVRGTRNCPNQEGEQSPRPNEVALPASQPGSTHPGRAEGPAALPELGPQEQAL